jgi:hypothetical protein
MVSSTRFRNSGLNAVQELGIERPLHFLADLVFHDLVAALGVAGLDSQAAPLGDVSRSEVRRHDEDGVLEVDDASVVVRQMSLVQDLEKNVEDIRVGLLDFVEKHDGIGTPPHGLGEGS